MGTCLQIHARARDGGTHCPCEWAYVSMQLQCDGTHACARAHTQCLKESRFQHRNLAQGSKLALELCIEVSLVEIITVVSVHVHAVSRQTMVAPGTSHKAGKLDRLPSLFIGALDMPIAACLRLRMYIIHHAALAMILSKHKDIHASSVCAETVCVESSTPGLRNLSRCTHIH
jgi:hypothetical protein